MAKLKLADRVAALELEVARLRALINCATKSGDWIDAIWGTFANDPVYDKAMRLGRQYRESLRPKPRKQRKRADRHSK